MLVRCLIVASSAGRCVVQCEAAQFFEHKMCQIQKLIDAIEFPIDLMQRWTILDKGCALINCKGRRDSRVPCQRRSWREFFFGGSTN